MVTSTIDAASRQTLKPHRLTIGEYSRMHETGIIPPDSRTELIEGQIFDMAPIGPRHQLVVDHLNEVLGARIDRTRAILRVQGPVRANDHTLPQPDLSILPRTWPGYPTQHPEAGKAFLLVEVADSTLLADSTIKAALYARCSAPEYWIIDLTTDEIVVHRDPENGAYASIERRRGDNLLRIAALPAITMTVSSIFD